MTLEDLLVQSAGVLSAERAREHVTKSALKWLTADGGRWQRPLPGVVVSHNGPMSMEQKLRAAALYGGPMSVLSHATSAVLDGLKGYADAQHVHILVPHPPSIRSRSFVKVHSSRNPPQEVGDVHPVHSPPRLRLPRAVIEMARGARTVDDARAPLAAAVQQRLTRPADLREVLARVGPARFQAQLFAALDDIELGAHSGLELQFLQLVREGGLPMPLLQERIDNGGLRYLDARWPAYNVWVEIDGAAHREDSRWQADLDRHNEISASQQSMRHLRFSAHLLRTRRARCARQLADALRLGGWPGVDQFGCRWDGDPRSREQPS